MGSQVRSQVGSQMGSQAGSRVASQVRSRSVKQYATLFNTGNTAKTTKFTASNTVALANPRSVNMITTQRLPPSTFSNVANGRNNNRTGRRLYNQNIDSIIMYKQSRVSVRHQPTQPKYFEPLNRYESLTDEQLRSWDRIHEMAIAATIPQLKQEFREYMNYLAVKFPCPMCADHIKQKLIIKPLTTLPVEIENGRDISYARWAWEFHNEINAKTSKPEVSWEYYKGRYLSRL